MTQWQLSMTGKLLSQLQGIENGGGGGGGDVVAPFLGGGGECMHSVCRITHFLLPV